MVRSGTFLPFDKILCPVDFSEPSYTALRAAREVSSQFSSRMTLLHVLHPMPPTGGSAGACRATAADTALSDQGELEEMARTSLREVADEEGLIRERVSLTVLHGDPAERIVGCANDQGHNLIVLATHGRTGWRRSVFGSVAERVIRLARCPVLTIGDPSQW